MMEKIEQPQGVAIRETREEAGIALVKVELARPYYASPSSTTEEVFVYTAECKGAEKAHLQHADWFAASAQVVDGFTNCLSGLHGQTHSAGAWTSNQSAAIS